MMDVPGQAQLTSGRGFERTHVQHVYNEIASSVNDIQHKAWPNVKRFMKKLDPGLLVADVGCGNGRYLKVNKNVFKIGMDVCQPLVDNARSKGHEVAHADNLNIPFRDGMFDAVISIGVIHHFCSSRRRVRAVQELARILCPGGRIMMYVWAFEQKRRKFDSQDVLVPWHERNDLKRNDSMSSYTSSLSRISSTSSVSEDDSVEIFDNDVNSATWEQQDPHVQQDPHAQQDPHIQQDPHGQQRQSTSSLQNIEALSDFRANYYALDFSSPKQKASFDFKRNASFNCKRNSLNVEGNNELVLECRKFETSLRTMSAGLLCETPATGNNNDPYSKTYDGESECQHGSLENLEIIDKHSSCTGFSITGSDEVSDVTNGPEELRECYKNGTATNNRSENSGEKAERKRSIHSRNHIKKSSAQVNPFLKHDSLDKYTFNNVVESHLPSIASVEEKRVTSPVFSIGDEISVEFKYPHVRNIQELPVDERSVTREDNSITNSVLQNETNANSRKEHSFFSFFKSKLSKLFDDEQKKNSNHNANHRLKSQSADSVLSRTDSSPSSLHVYGSSKNNLTVFREPELTDEQRRMAAKLNFAVREFPQSSRLTHHAVKSCKPDKNATQHSVTVSKTTCDKYTTPPVVFSLNDSQLEFDDTPIITDASEDNRMALSTPNIQDMHPPHLSATMEKPRRKSIAFDDLWNRLSTEISTEKPDILTADVLYDGYMRIGIDKVDGETNNDTCSGVQVNDMCVNVNDKQEEKLKKVTAEEERSYFCDESYISSHEMLTGAPRQNSLYSSTQCDTETCDNGMCNRDNVNRCNMNNATQCSLTSSQDTCFYSTDKKLSNGFNCDDSSNETGKKLSNGFNYKHSSNEMSRGGGSVDEVPCVSCVEEGGDVQPLSTKLSRYYHVFREGELEELISSHVTDLRVVQSFYDHANWCVIAEKV